MTQRRATPSGIDASLGHSRRRAIAVLAVAMALVLPALTASRWASAQVPPDITVPLPGPPPTEPPPSSTTTSTQPPTQSPPPQPPPADGHEGHEHRDSLPESVPTDPVVIPPPSGPTPPGPPEPVVREAAISTYESLQKGLGEAVATRAALLARVEQLRADVAGLEAHLAALSTDEQHRAERLAVARDRLRRRAVASYVFTPVGPLNDMAKATDVADLTRRATMVQTVLRAGRERVREHAEAKRQLDEDTQQVALELDRSRSALATATAILQEAEATLMGNAAHVSAVEAGVGLVTGGFVFPVAGPHSFSDSFGAPRMTGTPYAHAHQGTDIFAAAGTPLVAVERGVLLRVGVDTLGGTKLWLAAASGTRYYYAHLSAFAPGVADGKVVAAGELVGYVGSTGNARGTSAHLHFEVHPGGGAAINPYPILRLAQETLVRLRSGASPPGRR